MGTSTDFRSSAIKAADNVPFISFAQKITISTFFFIFVLHLLIGYSNDINSPFDLLHSFPNAGAQIAYAPAAGVLGRGTLRPGALGPSMSR